MNDSSKKSPHLSLLNIERLLKINRKTLKKVAQRSGAYYSPYDEEYTKKDGSKKNRHIDNPNHKLKTIQKRIYETILKKELLELPDGIIGGISKKSIKDNAQPHIGQEIVVTIDLKDCFPKTNNKSVFKVWRETLGCGEKVAMLMTQLTTFQRRLPQGAPTSSALCNFCLLPLFQDIKIHADKNRISFTLYVDDITISGKVPDTLSSISFIIKTIRKYGYSVSNHKIRKMPSNQQQKVTGVVVNKKVNIAHSIIEEVRNSILQIARRGSSITSTEYNSINGKIQNVKSYSEEKGEKLKEFAEMLLPETVDFSRNREKLTIKKCKHHKR